MSISQSLNNAVSGLTATSRMAEVVSSNLSNALTEGYARRVLDTSSASIGGQGAGVRIDGVRRISDPGLVGDRRLADAALAAQTRLSDTVARLEAQFSAPDDPAGLGGRVAALEQALVTAGADPASDQRLGVVVNRLNEVTAVLQQNARDVQSMRQTADADIARDVGNLNTALKQVEQLNADISRARITGGDPSALMDERQRAIDRIGEIVTVREVARPNDQLALITTSGLQLLDGPAMQFEFSQTPTITAFMTLASGGLSGVTRDGVPLDPTDGFGKLSGGSLAASFAARDTNLVAAQTALDEVAADLITRFADPTVDPTLGPTDAGLLTDAGGTHDPLDIVGLSRRIAVNAAVDPAQGGALFRVRDGVNAIAAGPIGDATQIDRWGQALSSAQTIGGGIPALSAVGQIARVAAQFGTERVQLDEAVTFAAARRDTLYQAELAEGVDTDQELQMLLRIEQAYGANAKLMQTINAMIQTLMEI
ncbi:flagellar hook-associated protein FlgK [Yoonia sp. R2331]|uniref:flagellar hook-associated protein FlgK n=1 Tax=Yoonia sp. R2331 TaxID=3237238 RepID=UPI0034E38B91